MSAKPAVPDTPPPSPARRTHLRRQAVAAFFLPIGLVTVLVALLSTLEHPRPDPDAYSDVAVRQRIAPVARHVLAGDAEAARPAAPASPPDPPPASSAEADARLGQQLYQSVCFACHATGVANAPIFGDRKAWAPYLATGTEAMLQVVIQGKGAMPPKGGADQASEAELRAAIAYLADAAR